jgi:hypothetical protein
MLDPMIRAQARRHAVPSGWDVVIEPDDELRHRVFAVSDDQLHAFVRAVVMHGVEDFRVVRQREGFGRDPYADEPAGMPWPDVGDDYIPV